MFLPVKVSQYSAGGLLIQTATAKWPFFSLFFNHKLNILLWRPDDLDPEYYGVKNKLHE